VLEWSPKEMGFKKDGDHPLDADVVIVDEASMIDNLLMHHFLKAVPRGSILVLVGDVNQLPSIGRSRECFERYHSVGTCPRSRTQ